MLNKNKLVLLITSLVVLFFVLTIFFWLYKSPSKSINLNQQNTNQPAINSNSNNSVPVNNAAKIPPINTNPAPIIAYPIDRFQERPTTNLFGAYYPASGHDHPDLKVCPTAKYYSGYHTGLDLEIFSTEQNAVVPVYTVADGKVRQAGLVTGYGTLVVIEFTINSATYTAYYGHVNQSTVTVKAGDAVIKGEKIAELGSACSTANGDVRKHLHFGLHKGTVVDVRGYVPDKAMLNTWVDPKTIFH